MIADHAPGSGILMHITSLPGPYGIGSLGKHAYEFADAIENTGMSFWQMLPVHPTVYANSPYLSSSSYAGNPLLIDLDDLAERGWLTGDELADHPPFDEQKVLYGDVIPWHEELRNRAYTRFMALNSQAEEYQVFRAWCEDQKDWLDDFALYMTLKEMNDYRGWVEWPENHKNRSPENDAALRDQYDDQITRQMWNQWVFFEQWFRLKNYLNSRGIEIIGDMPFYVGHDCCETWTDRSLFMLDADGNRIKVAGVGPDSFSATGQLWGNPIYNWERHRQDDYTWWRNRIDHALTLYDYLRIDHFRAFESYYEIPADHDTAANGEWVEGEGIRFFETLDEGQRLERLIAEDLGDRMEKAAELRDEVGLPGMIVIQFAVGGSAEETYRFEKDRMEPNRVVYLGTHDNNTFIGWYFNESSEGHKQRIEELIGSPERYDLHWAMIRYGMEQYKGRFFVVLMQDVLGLDASARMNRPSITDGNWEWRITQAQFDDPNWKMRLREITEQAGRAQKSL